MLNVCKNHGERYEILWNFQAIILKLDHSGFLKLSKVDFVKMVVFLPAEMIQIELIF
jgi:hypothetical protein